MRVSLTYCITFILLLGAEIIIALYVKDSIIRPYGGDTLVVLLIYSFLAIFLSPETVKGNYIKIAFSVLLFAFFVEITQALNLIKILGLERHSLASVILGTSFAWLDMLAYCVGFILIVIIEKIRYARPS